MANIYESVVLRGSCCNPVDTQEWREHKVDTDAKIIFYGKNNDHPEKLRRIQQASLQHSNIVGVAANLISGELAFKLKDKETPTAKDEELLKVARQKYEDWKLLENHSQIAHSLYSNGACPVILDWSIGETLDRNVFRIAKRDYCDFRLGKAINTFWGARSDYHYYCYFWNDVRGESITGKSIKSFKAYNKSKKIRNDWVLKLPVYGEDTQISDVKGGVFSYLISRKKESNKYYPKPYFESDVFWEKSQEEIELATLSRNTVKRGLRTDFIINVYRSCYDESFVDSDSAREWRNKDQQDIQEQYLGYENAGVVKVNFMGISHDGKAQRAEGSIEVVPIPNNNNFEEISAREDSIRRHISEAHSFGVQQLKGSQSSKTSFSNMAEFLSYGTEMYISTVIKPHCRIIERFYNDIINKNNGLECVETYIKISPPIIRALIKTFSFDLTRNERRMEVFGKEPLTVEQKEEVESIDNDTINNIANRIHERIMQKM